jgi:IclR family transcriptional regulator, acetate operon repressor
VTATEAFFVTRTMQAIEVLAFQPCSAPQVAGALQVHPRTARRLLNKLVAEGWLTRSEGRRRIYAPTMRIVALAAQLADRDPLALAARPAVTRLHEETGLTAHLAIPSYRSTLCLVHRAGGPDARPQVRELVPVHATAAGKVLLAFREPWRLDVLSRPLEPVTARTVVDADELAAEAARAAERGFALDDGEFLPGLRGVAVPVRDASGGVPASLAVAGPATELELELVDGLVELLRARASEIERTLRGDGRG